MRKGLCALVACLLTFAWVSDALARPQEYAFGFSKKETGFRLGSRGRLHTDLYVMGGYDTNVYYSDALRVKDYLFDIAPSAIFNWRGNKLDVDANYRLNMRRYLEQTLQNNMAHRAELGGIYRWSRRISTELKNEFEKTSDPADLEIPERLRRITNESSAEVLYATPGKDLDIGLRYTFMYRKYDADLSALSFYNNKVSLTSRVNVSSHFRFLPKSVLFGNVEYGNNNFQNDPAPVPQNSDSDGVDMVVGLRSQFSRRFGGEIRLGGNMVFFDEGPDAHNITGGAQVDYKTGRGGTFTLSYSRNAQISTFTNYMEEHKVDFDWRLRLLRRFELVSETTYRLVDYSGPTTNLDGSLRQDNVVQSTTTLKYAIRRWAELLLRYRVDWRLSNAIGPVVGAGRANFTKHQIMGGFSVYY